MGALADEILVEVDSLCEHEFGHHVAQSIVEYGLPRQSLIVFNAIRREPMRSALHRSASHIIETVLVHRTAEERSVLAGDFLENPANLPILVQNQFGCHVIRAVLRQPGVDSAAVLCNLAQLSTQVQGTR